MCSTALLSLCGAWEVPAEIAATQRFRRSCQAPPECAVECQLLLWLGGGSLRAGSCLASWARAVASATAPALAHSLAFALSLAAAVSRTARPAVWTSAAVLFNTGFLPGSPFLLRLGRTTVALTIPTLSGPVLRESRHGCAAEEQTRHHQSCKCFPFHVCPFLLFCYLTVLDEPTSSCSLDEWETPRLCRGLEFGPRLDGWETPRLCRGGSRSLTAPGVT
jgi:hypothetical protein